MFFFFPLFCAICIFPLLQLLLFLKSNFHLPKGKVLVLASSPTLIALLIFYCSPLYLQSAGNLLLFWFFENYFHSYYIKVKHILPVKQSSSKAANAIKKNIYSQFAVLVFALMSACQEYIGHMQS